MRKAMPPISEGRNLNQVLRSMDETHKLCSSMISGTTPLLPEDIKNAMDEISIVIETIPAARLASYLLAENTSPNDGGD